MTDPLIYKLLAVANVAVFGSFFFRYFRAVLRDRTGKHWWNKLRTVELFALGLLGVFLAVFVYQLLPLLRQFYGEGYWGRDQVRIFASSLLLLSGCAMHYVLSHTHRDADNR